MALFSSSSSISLGMAFTDAQVLAVRLDQEQGILLNAKPISPETMQNGIIQNEQDVVTALVGVLGKDDLGASGEGNTPEAVAAPVAQKKWWEKLLRRKSKVTGSGETGAAICIPPQAVYTALFAIPTVVGKDVESEVIERIQKTLPIAVEDIMVTWRQVGKSEDSQHVAVAGVSKSYLAQYESLCQRQKLRLESVSTPASIIWLAAAENQKENAILINRLPNMSATSTFMYNHWPIDELVLPAGYSLEDQVKETKQMIEEQAGTNGIVPRRIVFIGPEEDFTYLQEQGGFDVPIEKTTFAVPERMLGYELGLFSILSARKDKLMNMLATVPLADSEE